MNFFKALWEAICETTVEQIEEIKQAEPPPQEQSSYNDTSASNLYTLDSHSLYSLDSTTIHNPNNSHYD